MREIPDEPEGKSSAEEAGRIKETTVPSISRLVALGSLAPEDVKAVRKFPEPPSFAVHPTRPSHIPNVVEKRVPNNYQIPLSLATAVVSAHSQAKKELGIRRSGLRSYMQSICSFCLGHDADWDINELSAQLPEWSELIALASPLLSRETTNNPREIGRKMSAIESVAGQVAEFLSQHYRGFPQKIALRPVTGWFRWSVRWCSETRWESYDSYLLSILAFIDPPLSVDTEPQVIKVFVPDVSSLMDRAEELRRQATVAATDRSKTANDLALSLDRYVSSLQKIIIDIDTGLHKAYDQGKI